MKIPCFAFLLSSLLWVQAVAAQTVTVSTVTRSPFSMEEGGQDTGFSMDLLTALAEDLGWAGVEVDRHALFADMLDQVRDDAADLAIANISITAAREQEMDFSQPIFESGLQIMVPRADASSDTMVILRALVSADLLVAIGIAVLILFGGGMLMWAFERRAQPYFDRPAREALFPSFWWALNLVVNGGFEERVPRTVFGRIFAVLLVVSSLFVVSIFVAKITAALTVEAITGSVNSVNDLYGQRVATLEGSTSAAFLDRREIEYDGFADLGALLAQFEDGTLDAVVFDAPILSHYVTTSARGQASLVGPVFMRENYGIAFPSGSPLVEEVNRALLRLREDGTYDDIYRRWFGRNR
ncbi:MAG: transporter substrate-binding domain-containing protein [Marinibacterium sp.]|nr:transporter substrate-binding domain-containing protein [Marinibacterium sp.]